MNSTRSVCRGCGHEGLEPILGLGRQPLANALRSSDQLDQPELSYPLDLGLCPRCALVQITETLPAEILFREYLYFSSFSDTMLSHAEMLTSRVVRERSLGEGSLVVEVGSNDGYLLQFYKRAGIRVLGIEPARNIARWAEEHRGIPTLSEFFGESLARDLALRHQKADVIHAHNVMAHVADLNGFVAGLDLLLKENGVAVIEVPYLLDMVENTEFDTIYHEHLCYFSATAVDALFGRHGLSLVDVERMPIHGGTLRMFVAKVGGAAKTSQAVRKLLDDERDWGIDRIDSYRPFARKVETLRADLLTLLARLKGEGRRLAAYGASAKGSTLLNYVGIGRETLDFVADRSTIKQGRLTPGTHLPILPPEAILEQNPDYVLLLTWNFKDEILRQQRAYLDGGGRFIVPIPKVAIVEPTGVAS